MIRITRAVKWLLVVNAAAFLLELLLVRLAGGLEFLRDDLAISSERFFGGAVWQPLTYMFLHDPQGITHLLLNMLMLWMFGSPLESFWGTRRFLFFYFITGVGSAAVILLVGLLLPSQEAVSTIGASGVLYALLVAFGFNFPNQLIHLFGLFPIKGKHLVLLFIGLGLVQSFTLSAANESLAAHFGGMLFGFLLVTGAWRPTRICGAIRGLWRGRRHRRLKNRC